ncbi:hypothetical protein [Romboutsia sp.]|uniref:hypothetical protein n=1 Tax=Romboutsia sp. TaxID=1965302 RepID=UPI003F332444
MLKNKSNQHPLGYSEQSYHGQAINYSKDNKKGLTENEKMSLNLLAFIDSIGHMGIDTGDLFSQYKKIIEVIKPKYIYTLKHLIRNTPNTLDNSISIDQINLMAKTEELEILAAKGINTIEGVEYFELLPEEKENLEQSKYLIQSLIDIKNILESLNLDTSEFEELVRKFCEELDSIKEQIEYLAIRHFTYLIENGYHQLASALLIGAQFLKEVSLYLEIELASYLMIEEFEMREYQPEVLCSLYYGFTFEDLKEELNTSIDSRVADLILL